MVISPAPASGPPMDSLPRPKRAIPLDAAAVVRPGDILVVRISHRVDQAGAARLKQVLLGKLPGIADVVIIDGADQLAVYRPPDADASS